jgi:hypothetical protein
MARVEKNNPRAYGLATVAANIIEGISASRTAASNGETTLRSRPIRISSPHVATAARIDGMRKAISLVPNTEVHKASKAV